MMLANGMKFIDDEAVIGKWKNIGWTEDMNCRSIDRINAPSGDYEDLYFLPEGEPYWVFEGWTKGFLLIHYGGDAPVLTYEYVIENIGKDYYLFLRLDDKTEIFIKESSERYKKELLGRHDKIDFPFVYDEMVIGLWKSVAFVDEIKQFNPNEVDNDLYLKSIVFKPDGTAIQKYMDEEWCDRWTKGSVLNLHRITTASYEIHTIVGKQFLFLEWKMGNYIYGGIKPSFYVFSR